MEYATDYKYICINYEKYSDITVIIIHVQDATNNSNSKINENIVFFSF